MFGPRYHRLAIVLMLVAFLADLATTLWAVLSFGGVEGNPLVAFAIGLGPLAFVAIKVAAAVLAAGLIVGCDRKLRSRQDSSEWWRLWAVSASAIVAPGAVALHNFLMIVNH